MLHQLNSAFIHKLCLGNMAELYLHLAVTSILVYWNVVILQAQYPYFVGGWRGPSTNIVENFSSLGLETSDEVISQQ